MQKVPAGLEMELLIEPTEIIAELSGMISSLYGQIL